MIKLHSVVGPVETRVVNWIQGHSHLISRVIVLGYLGTRKFSRITILTRYHVSIVELTKQDLKSEVVKLFRGPRTLIKIFYFVSLWPGSKTFSFIGRGWTFIDCESYRGTSHRVTWPGCFNGKAEAFWAV